MNNNRQLALAWRMYNDDNGGKIPYASINTGQAINSPINVAVWTYTEMDFTPSSFNWDINVDQGGGSANGQRPLWPYAGKSPGIFRCPADTSYVVVNGQKKPRCRSIAMNLNLGGFGGSPFSGNETIYTKTTDIDLSVAKGLGASKLWVFIDERQDRINWGNYYCDMTGFESNPSLYEFDEDMPGIYHNNGAGFAFADGHAELHHWTDGRTCPPMSNGEIQTLPLVQSPNNKDIAWLQDHSDRPLN
jgi:prepilin-type processing-associated H-X9-DG protein